MGTPLAIHRGVITILTISALSITLGCSQFARQGSSDSAPIEDLNPPPPAEPEIVKVPDRPFEQETLYSLMVAEMAGNRKRYDVMLQNYLQQAEFTRDPGVVAMASRVARYLNAHNDSLAMALLWTELEPNNMEARYNATAELVYFNRLEEAFEHSQVLLQNGENTGFDSIGARAIQGGDVKVSQALIQSYQHLLQSHPDHLPLWTGLSFLAQHTGDLELSLNASQKAIELDAESFQAAAQETRVLQQMGQTDKALEKLGELVEKNPDNHRLRLQYARSLMKSDLAASQLQFEELFKLSPNDKDLRMTLGLIQYERGLLDEAAETLSMVKDHPSRASTTYYYLGRIAQVQHNDDLAIEHFSAVGPGSDYLPAMAQLADIYVAQSKADKALQLLREERQRTPAEQSQQAEGLYLLEAHVLSSSARHDEALATLENAIQAQPDSTKLMYSRAMLFAQMDQLAEAEHDLRRIIALSPNDAAALNALGYTLADRTDRLDEAYEYISRAYSLTPNDPAVMDSMGWVEYLKGNTQAALIKLRAAMKAMPDHEIAAHLGEVLWVTGETEEARVIWQQGLELKPESPVILKTLDKFEVKIKP